MAAPAALRFRPRFRDSLLISGFFESPSFGPERQLFRAKAPEPHIRAIFLQNSRCSGRPSARGIHLTNREPRSTGPENGSVTAKAALFSLSLFPSDGEETLVPLLLRDVSATVAAICPRRARRLVFLDSQVDVGRDRAVDME